MIVCQVSIFYNILFYYITLINILLFPLNVLKYSIFKTSLNHVLLYNTGYIQEHSSITHFLTHLITSGIYESLGIKDHSKLI